MSTKRYDNPSRPTKREKEYCDDCGEVVGYYDPSRPDGEKIIITRDCECVRRMRHELEQL